MTMTADTRQTKRPNAQRPRVVGVKTEVPLYNGERVRYVNLDSAASTSPLIKVRQAVDDFLPWYSSVHRGSGYKSRLSTHLYEKARDAVMRFVGATPATHVVIFVRNTTEAINLLAHRIQLEPDELVLSTRMEHHSNLLPWFRRAHEIIDVTAEGRLDMEALEQRLQHHNGKVRLVTITAASNVSGLITDIRRAARLAHAHGALIAVDAAQLAPHRTLDMGTPGTADAIDIVAFSGHKLYAPYGTGALVVPATLFVDGEPMLVGGGTACLVTNSGIKWATGPDLEEAGSPNVIGVVAMAAALEELMRYGMDRVAEHERELTEYAIRRLQAIPGLKLYGPSWEHFLSGAEDRLGVICFNMEGRHYGEVAAILANEWGVGVRSGCFCAHLYVAHLLGISEEDAAEARDRLIAGLPVDLPGMVRASFSLSNTKDDVDRLASGLLAISRGEIRAEYTRTEEGDFEPVNAQHLYEEHGDSFLQA
ncbi:selenocysteine lyase/cysteine desulfurase [Thermosporothrix hazakensis]|uniref:Selenocysteine lyase/cysteine desulfurase n=1 Tax=Thermosporothrix hazakensis TaxID=644383 RepID=A0A326UK87_THEHA|nr:aminotransferase class V-fold PLP-dependent enzyme [Thermosporothrix hazakensis]PZW32843.1 selenocysteine lyase/cysteine desulfurase [Thermosporothrix hazakensis]GCE48874.1 class V aminotransferase [Thermosporothrix hazakensis]